MKFELEPYHRNVSEQDLIDDLIWVSKLIKSNSVTHEEYNSNGKYSSTTYQRRFGSWFKALEKSGLQKTRTPANVPKNDLFKNLEDVWVKLGRQPLYKEIQKPLSKYHVGTYENRFGSWRKALEAFVKYINDDQSQIKEEKETVPEKIERNKEEIIRHKTKRNINSRLKVQVLIKHGNKCKICGITVTGDNIHIDHIKPWSKGGETVIENLQVLCSKCNLGKGDWE